MTEQSTNQGNEILQTVSRQGVEVSLITEMKKTALSKIGYMDKGSGEHQSNQVFNKDGICPTLPSVSYKEPLKIIDDE